MFQPTVQPSININITMTYIIIMTEIIKVDQAIINKTFPSMDNIDKSLLQMTAEGVYSVSGVNGSCFMADIIMTNMGTKDLIITDGTGNNGSETIIYSILFNKVNSIEMDPVNFTVLKNNVEVYNLKNVNLIYGDTIEQLDNLVQDVIVLDAPWGGPDYKKYKIVNKFWDKTKLFVLKVPRNYDLNNFSEYVVKDFEVYNYISSSNPKKPRFKVIVLHNKNEKHTKSAMCKDKFKQ
jgi:predicted RNA methylase